MRRPAVPPQLCRGPFTLAEAAAAGVSPRMLAGAAWRRLFRGVYIHASLPVGPRTLAAAALLAAPPGAVLAGRTAAALHGLDLGSSAPVEVLLPRTGRSRAGRCLGGVGVLVGTARLTDDDVTHVAGVAVTTPLRTAFDLARRGPLVEAVVRLDAMTHARLVTVTQLAEYVALCGGARGVRVVREALPLVEPDAESPMESRTRMVLVLGGLPRPAVQHRLIDPNGLFVARLDLAYPGARVGIEYDGAQHGGTWQRDLDRMYAVMAEGWWLRRYTATDVLRRPALICAEVAHALGRAA